ncbi:MAG: type II toxin-antitoxin system VapC family toxin [Opitutaceae bacterium]|nr:type II toxin-antitoxin system VapC family toxin [Opitutaceae bacterium]
MSHLLDSHVFLWCALQPEGLSARVRDLLAQPETRCAVSAVSFWELSLKHALGKLDLTGVTPGDFPRLAERMRFDVLPLDGETAASFHELPSAAHRDPFDRLLVWQAIRSKLTLISGDRALDVYRGAGLRRFW